MGDPNGGFSSYKRPRPTVDHRISVAANVVLRDGKAVKITRINDEEIKVGCTVVTVEALNRILHLVHHQNNLQDGAE
jgi:hypothetical protein